MDINPKATRTVSELIYLLQQMPQNVVVQVEGCDCYGDCKGVTMYEDMVLIERFVD